MTNQTQTKEHTMQPTPLETRFTTAATSTQPTDEQLTAVKQLQDATINLAAHIETHVPNGRNKAISLTALEDVLMRANRGIFQDN